MVNRIRGWLRNNYFEGAEITKVEVFLLIAVVAVFLPFLYSDLGERIGFSDGSLSDEQIKWLHNQADYIKTKEAIIEEISEYNKNPFIGLEKSEELKSFVVPNNPQYYIDRYNDEIPYNNEMTFMEWYDKTYPDISIYKAVGLEEPIIVEPNEMEVNKAVYKHLKSPEYHMKIYAVFVITMTALIVTVILSRKGYTSYTPWLEKLANDKLTFDLKLFQYVDEDKLKAFFSTQFKLYSHKELEAKAENPNKMTDEEKEQLEKIHAMTKDEYKEMMIEDAKQKIETTDVLGWKPVNEDEKWYSIFTEKIDYRFYELAFEKLWAEWCEDNYNRHRNAAGEYEPKYERPRELYDNPELVPDMDNDTIKEELEKPLVKIKTELNEKISKFWGLKEGLEAEKNENE